MTGLFGFYYTSSFTDLFLGSTKPNPKAIARMCSIYLSIYSIHFDSRFFNSIQKVDLSWIRTHDLVLTVHTL